MDQLGKDIKPGIHNYLVYSEESSNVIQVLAAKILFRTKNDKNYIR